MTFQEYFPLTQSGLVRFAGRGLAASILLTVCFQLGGCATGEVRAVDKDSAAMEGFRPIEDYYVVDCLLPGEVRQMGKMTYLSPRVHVKTEARDCKIRGGEYVLYSRANYKSALNVWLDQAKSGNAEAQVIVGEIYEKGLGVEPQYDLAAQWYLKAAEQGNTRAQLNLAYLYEEGLGVEQDLVVAMNWYRKASGLSQDELILASAANEKIEKMRAQLEQELAQSQAQQNALQSQIAALREQVEKSRQQSAGAPVNADQAKTIQALEQLLSQTEMRLNEKTERLAQLKEVEVETFSITRGTAPEGPVELRGFNFGSYYALIIGLENYKYWDDLKSPREDAQRIAELLRNKYGFSTTVVLDADAYDILGALNDLREQAGPQDNVLIYFAGHGQLRQALGEGQIGYWLPVNAQQDRTTYWLPNSQINEQLALLDARSVLVVSDSCYAGAMSSDPASLLMGGRPELSKRLIELGLGRRARYVLASGGVKPVLDMGDDGHSVFARAMINVLANSDDLLRAQDLLLKVMDQVETEAAQRGFEQRPELRPIRSAGHLPGGSFFLVPKKANLASSSAVPSMLAR